MQRAAKKFTPSFQHGSIILLLWGAFGSAAIATAQSSGTFARTGNLITTRSQHTATLLPNGKVLIAAGIQQSASSPGSPIMLASAELYDPGAGTFSPAADMTTGRRLHTSTLLADGRVLIAGGYGGAGGVVGYGTATASAELYDPSTGTFMPTGDMIAARGGHTAILLPNGKVLIVGGYGTSSSGGSDFPNVAPAELYDPVSGKFTAAGTYVSTGACDFCAPGTLLANGTVLFPGQYPAQVYDPITDSFRRTGMMIFDHSTATLLMNGKVLFAGGESDVTGRTSRAELYDPATGAFAATGSMACGRVWHSLTLLPNGTVLTAGGESDSCGFGSVATAELYDASTGRFLTTDNMAGPREVHTATLLNDGRVLITGGSSFGGIGLFFGSLASAELYTPAVLVPPPALISLSGTGKGQGAIFHARTSHAAAPDDPAAIGEDLDIDCTGLSNESVIPPQVAIGGRMAEVVSFGDAPGIPGRNQVRVRVPSGIAPGPAVPVRLTYIGRVSNDVTIAVAP
jgi:hypothetical protein